MATAPRRRQASAIAARWCAGVTGWNLHTIEVGKLEQSQKQWELAAGLLQKVKAATQKPGSEKHRSEGEHKKPSPEAVKDSLRAAEKKIDALRAEGRHEEADKVARYLKEATAKQHAAHGKEPGSQDPRQRLQHLSEAAEHLRAAGLVDMAENLSRQAAEMKQQIAHASPGHDCPAENRELAEQVQQLRREVQELREIVKRLTERDAKQK